VDPDGLYATDENGDVIVDENTSQASIYRYDEATQEEQDVLNDQAMESAHRAYDVVCMFLPFDKFFRPLKFFGGRFAAKAAKAAKNATKEIKVRPTPGRDSATSTHIV